MLYVVRKGRGVGRMRPYKPDKAPLRIRYDRLVADSNVPIVERQDSTSSTN